MSFKNLYWRIKDCSLKDDATKAEIMLYINEESGEISRALSQEIGIKPADIKETVPQECCDLLISTLALIARYNWSIDDIKEYMDKKLQKYENNVKHKGYKWQEES